MEGGESAKKTAPKNQPLLKKHLNSKSLSIGYKLGDGTSGKVYLATVIGTQKSYALKQIKLKIHKIIFVKTCITDSAPTLDRVTHASSSDLKIY